jgi:hypothetical protein
MGKTKFDERTGANTRVRSASNCSTSGSGDEMSGPFKSYDFKQMSGMKRSSEGCAWTDKSGAKKKPTTGASGGAHGAWGQTFKNEANFKQMHWC